ncbi:MAG: hypothetical protein LIO62_05985 [Clostridiales bacterium]|nr:hypothetical protein [Clostridiales bacterium]
MYEIANSFATNEHSEFLVFIHVGYGYILRFLYTLLPSINWYSIMYLVAFNICFITLFKIVADYESPIYAIGLVAFCQGFLYINLTFTILAFLCVATGILWTIHKVKKVDKNSIGNLLYSFFLILMGFGFRRGYSILIVLLLLFVPLYFFSIIRKRNSVISVLVVFCMIPASFGILTATQNLYVSNVITEESYFTQFNEYRSAVTDSGQNDYEEHAEEYAALGLTENDIYLASRFMYADKNVFSAENIEGIVEARDIGDSYNLNVLSVAKQMVTNKYVFAFACFALLMFIICKGQRFEIFSIAFTAMVALLYLFVCQRPRGQVLYPIIVCTVLMLLYSAMIKFKGKALIKDWKKEKLNKLMCVVFSLALVFNVGLSYKDFNTNGNSSRDSNFESIYEYIENNTEYLYLYCHGFLHDAQMPSKKISLLTSEKSTLPLYYISGDWIIYTPYWYDMLEQIGLEDYYECPFKAVLEENAVVVSKLELEEEMDAICTFLNEHYDMNVTYELIDVTNNDNVGIYRFVNN